MKQDEVSLHADAAQLENQVVEVLKYAGLKVE